MQQVQQADLGSVPNGEMVLAIALSGSDINTVDKLVKTTEGYVVLNSWTHTAGKIVAIEDMATYGPDLTFMSLGPV